MAADRATFIVRLTREEGAGWRGEVEYVQGGTSRAAADVAGAMALVWRWLERVGHEREPGGDPQMRCIDEQRQH